MSSFTLTDETSLLREIYSATQDGYDYKSSNYLLWFMGSHSKNLISEHLKELCLASTKPDELRAIWKSLIIDAINFLRINDARERSFWKDNKQSKSSPNDADAVGPLNAYGVEELYSYFEEFTVFESILYGADNRYRDHVQHPLIVWMIGINILFENVEYFSFRVATKELAKVEIGESAPHDCLETKSVPLKISSAEIGAMWTIIALTHDLGYPLQKVDKINAQLQKMLERFGRVDFSASEFNIGHQHSHLVKHLLALLSSSLENCATVNELIFYSHLRAKYLAKFSKSWEAFDHGIVSSFILLRSLNYFLETDLTDNDGKRLKAEDARQFIIRAEMLHAIAAHTTPKIYHILANNLAFLLLLADDLHEWNRPTMSDIMAHDQSGAQAVRVEELSITSESSRIRCVLEYPACDHDLQCRHVIKIFKTWHERLRPAVDDLRRKMFFTWQIKFAGTATPWVFNFNSESPAFHELKVEGPGASGDEKTPYNIYDPRFL